ncbi:MAG TPA: hypothetical protein DEB39_08605 [Planctomycetaceae bacterium]|nr:hypothetical protein [Planctomycetaceae bacterium]
MHWKRDENGHFGQARPVKFACRAHSSQLHCRKLLKRIVRAAGDCAREQFQAVCGIKNATRAHRAFWRQFRPKSK